MGKRSTGRFERRERDFYQTPYEAVAPLAKHFRPFLKPYNSKDTKQLISFIEPCAGDFTLARHLISLGFYGQDAFDIYPMHDYVSWGDATDYDFCYYRKERYNADFYISNPPWDRNILHPIIENLSSILPTWLLFDADWMHTKQSASYMKICKKIISVGRIKWIENSNSVGKDNAAWYFFDINHTGPTQFIGRQS